MIGIIESTKPWIIQKYGGTSLGNLLETITITIIPEYLLNNKVAVVCSAISGTTKSFGTTSLLLKACEDVMLEDQDGDDDRSDGDGDGDVFHRRLDETIGRIRDEHLKAGKGIRLGVCTKGQGLICDALERDIGGECEGLREILKAARTIGELSERSKDRVLATGERLACKLVVASLMVKGMKAEVVSLADIITTTFGPSIPTQQKAYETQGPLFFTHLSTQINHLLQTCASANTIPVITGFFGPMPIPMLQLVGRGYSDLCAAICAVSVSATELQIWKEVDGIFTADPRKIPSARLLATVTLEEASELSYYGSEVIHPFTMRQVRDAGICIRLKNVKNPGGCGTVIYPDRSPCVCVSPACNSPMSNNSGGSGKEGSRTGSGSGNGKGGDGRNGFMCANGYDGDIPTKYRRSPTAITSKDEISLLNIQSNRRIRLQGFLAAVFATLDRFNVVADLVTTSEQSVSVAVSSEDLLAAREMGVLGELEGFGVVDVRGGMAIVSVVGHRMRNMVGIAGEIFSRLAKGGVNIYLIGQGASEINISCVVKADNALLAMGIIHTNVLGIPNHAEHIPIVQNSMMKGPWLY